MNFDHQNVFIFIMIIFIITNSPEAMANWMYLGMVGVNMPRIPTRYQYQNHQHQPPEMSGYLSEDPLRQPLDNSIIQTSSSNLNADLLNSQLSVEQHLGHAMSTGQFQMGPTAQLPLPSPSLGSVRPSAESFRQTNLVTSHAGEKTTCAKVPGLVSQQLRVCQAHPNAMYAVSEGAKRGIKECQKQFKNERWNCTTEGDESVFGHTLQRGSRETAFIYAVTSAGVVHAITQACSAGNLTDCYCDRSRQGQTTPDGWKWGGCSDNIRYGMLFAKHFVDAPERAARKKTRDIRALMNLHNNHAGRLAIANLMELKCRCHGVSGSCELKTCWRTLSSFNQVGHYLKQKYENSVQISPKAKKRLRRKGKVKRKVPVRKEDLVHIHKSPNFCIEDPKRGILGTTGRQCNKTSTGPESCNLLCCGRGYNTQVFRHVERCLCRFHWCCFVTCSVCEQLVEVYTCK